MSGKDSAFAVLLGVLTFAVVASGGLFVEGDATGGTEPGLHPTTEMGLSSIDEAVDVVDVLNSSVPLVVAAPEVSVKEAQTNQIPQGYVYWKTIRAKVTAYDPSRISCGKFADGRTSIGENAWRLNGAAADPRAIPYGTYVSIPGVGARVIDDTGSAMRRAWDRNRQFHIDLRVTYPYQARQWGIKYIDVKLYRKEQ